MLVMATIIPSLFIGHGNPMNVLGSNEFTQGWKRIGESFEKPQAILAISAHWYAPGIGVTVSTNPRTIYDFYGFPNALYEVQYPVLGDPVLAERVRQLLKPIAVEQDKTWGLDHGVWTILKHMYPLADVPVVQLKIDASQSLEFHFELGNRLAPLRGEGVLILGSGNLVHNLRAYSWNRPDADAYDWATRFERRIVNSIDDRRFSELLLLESMGRDAALAVPSPDHYLPLLYTLGSVQSNDQLSWPILGFEGGSISMRSFIARS